VDPVVLGFEQWINPEDIVDPILDASEPPVA
jgi:hypothetical protein